MRIYLAGPYTQGDPERNTHNALLNADVLIALGFSPFVPHLSHFQHAVFPRAYEDWMRIDFDFVEVCDAVLRMPGYSPGADREVEHATKLGIPVFLSIHDLMTYRELKGVK